MAIPMAKSRTCDHILGLGLRGVQADVEIHQWRDYPPRHPSFEKLGIDAEEGHLVLG